MKNFIQHIFLDIDGVLADFNAGALRVHDRLDLLDDWPVGERDVPKILGLSRTQYWRAIEAEGFSFWENLRSILFPRPWNRNHAIEDPIS